MAEETASDDADLDEDGLVIQKYASMVLVVVPPQDYGDEALRYARSSLYNVHVGTRSVSTNHEELIKGRLQDEFMTDGPIAGESMNDYSGIVFAGGEGARDLFDDQDVMRLAREARDQGKMIGAWGHAVGILAMAGVVKGVRVSGHEDVADLVKRAGGRFAPRQLQEDGLIVTAADDAVGMRFGKALAAIVGI